ncbi:MAG: neutral/alkaline non-lysosomal ceramidase N-terminal domain-containing protein [Elusimicrobiota bacterium]|jgi:hypothetical protein
MAAASRLILRALLALAIAGDPAFAAPRSISRAAGYKVDITPSLEANRVFLAGYGAKGRRAEAVHDRLYARVAVFSDGTKTVAIVSLDLFGLYREDVLDLRRMSHFDRPDRYLFVTASHTHSGPDTLGMWGPVPGVSGVDQGYMRGVKEKVAAAVLTANDRLKQARLRSFSKSVDPKGLCRDRRDPAIVDPVLSVLSAETLDNKPLATLVNWSCHPEVLDASNTAVSADFPGSLCARLEAERGGVCLFLPGSIGGLMTPDVSPARGFAEVERVGSELAGHALAALSGKGGGSMENFPVDFRSETVRLPIENSRYLLFLPSLAFGHKLYDPAGTPLPASKAYTLAIRHALTRLPADRRPWIETEVSYLTLGRACGLGLPGEAFPELIIGGYKGEFKASQPLTDPSNPDPPDLAKAPAGPYLKDLMPCKDKFVVNLANDEIGYLVPEYDFKIRDNLTLLPRLPGHHYEETNSIGRSATGIVTDSARRLMQ